MTKKKTSKNQTPIRETGGQYTIYLEENSFKITPKAVNYTLTSNQVDFLMKALSKQKQRGNGEIKMTLWRSADKANEYSPPKYPLSIFANGKINKPLEEKLDEFPNQLQF